MHPVRIGCSLALVLCVAGCPAEPPPPPPPATPPTPAVDPLAPAGESPPPPPADPRLQRAQAAAKKLGGQLKQRLKAAIDERGFPAGIEVCKVAAPEIAAAVGADTGLKLGRTSFKLRNPANAVPAWAAEPVKARAEDPYTSTAADGALQVLLPIHTEPLCLACHGPADQLAEPVRAALAEHYPEDQATGFQEGDLRGWFWVEVPAE